MKRLALLACVCLLASCKKEAAKPVEPPVRAVVAGLEMIEYREPSGAFEIIAPATWKLWEDDSLGPSATLLGPGSAKYPRSVSIHISRYPNQVDKSPDPEKYYKAIELIESFRDISPFAKRVIGNREVEHYSSESPSRKLHERKILYYSRDDHAIIRFPGGFYSIVHSAPVEIYQETLPVFEAVVASFKAGPLPATAP